MSRACTLGLLCNPGVVILHVVLLLANIGLLYLFWLSRQRPITWWERASWWFLVLVVTINAAHSVYLLVLRSLV